MSHRSIALTIFFGILLLLAHRTTASAAEVGTVIVEQRMTEYLGKWGLATPTGPIEGESQLFTSEKPAGSYILTITSPAGAVSKIAVYNEDTLTKTFDGRTAIGTLTASGTLKFEITYDFILLGDISVISNPSDIRFDIKGPRGTERGVTPGIFRQVPEGDYVVYYFPKAPCPSPRPISRRLEAGGRIAFEFNPTCPSLAGEGGSQPTREERTRERREERAPEVNRQQREEARRAARERTEQPTPPPQAPASVLVSLSSPSAEVTAGGGARFTLSVRNTGTEALQNLEVDFQFDSTQFTVQRTSGTRRDDHLTWTISSLAPDDFWEQTVSGTVSRGLSNGATVTASVIVSGDAISAVPSSDRSALAQVAVLQELPKTGVPLDLFFLLLPAAATFLVFTAGGVWEVVKHAAALR